MRKFIEMFMCILVITILTVALVCSFYVMIVGFLIMFLADFLIGFITMIMGAGILLLIMHTLNQLLNKE